MQIKPFKNEAQSPFRDFAFDLAVFNFDGNLVVLIGGVEMRRVVVNEPLIPKNSEMVGMVLCYLILKC